MRDGVVSSDVALVALAAKSDGLLGGSRACTQARKRTDGLAQAAQQALRGIGTLLIATEKVTPEQVDKAITPKQVDKAITPKPEYQKVLDSRAADPARDTRAARSGVRSPSPHVPG